MGNRCRMSAILIGWLVCVGFVHATLGAEYLLQGRVYEGVPWEQDKPMQGVTVELWGANTSGQPQLLINSAQTDSSGWYGLLLDPGDWAYDYYIIWERNKAGYVSTDAKTVGGTRLNADQIQFGWPLEGVDFTGNKFWDKPEGQPPVNHPPVADADGPYTGQVAQPITFDGSGSYDPDAGDSIVSYEWDLDNDGQYDDATGVTVQHTWNVSGSGTVGLRVTDTFGDAGVDSSTYTIEEGPQATGTIRGAKFNDLNGNSVRDAGEPGLAGWQITLEDGDGNALATASTDGNGAYEFSSLEPGAYRVDEVQQSGWRQTHPEVDGQPAWWAIGLEGGAAIDEVDFGNRRDDSPPGPEYEEEHGDAPEPYYDFYLSVSETVFLGSVVDGEVVMQRDPHALGDDHNDGSDDEDGVEFVTSLLPGQQATVRIDLTGVTGPDWSVSGRIDFDQSGGFDAAESIIDQSVVLTASIVNTVTFTVPATAQPGPTFARFYIIDTGPEPPWGWPYGEVEDYEVTIGEGPGPLEGEWDFGDAPEGVIDSNSYNYPTTLAHNGARHKLVTPAPWLGYDWGRPDAELDGQPSVHAIGDDLGGDDDEFWSGDFPVQGRTRDARIHVNGGGGHVDAWIDFNRDGTWQHPQERIVSLFLLDGFNQVDYAVPDDAVPGATYVRVRINSKGPLPPYGPADDGEVEDSTTFIYEADYGDAPDPPYPTLDASGGPWAGVPGYFLGARVDGELDGQPDGHALGDDNDGTDDDDGVTFLTKLIPGQEATVKVVVELEYGNPNAEEICAWIDFNQNGSWEKTELAIRQGPLKCTGKPEEYECKFVVPKDALLGTTYARFTVTYLTYSLSGPASQRVHFAGAAVGSASDSDADGRDEVDAELVDLNLTGIDPVVGSVQMRLNTDQSSTGRIEERVNNTPGVLDVPPYAASGTADSFFDVWIEIELPDLGMCFRSSGPIRLTGVIDHVPPLGSDVYAANLQTPVALFKGPCGGPWPALSGPPDVLMSSLTSCHDQPGSVTIIKRATPADDTRFDICAVFAPGAFFNVFCQPLQDPSNPQWVVSSPDLLERVREEVPAGWTLKNITVTGDTDQGSSVDLSQGIVDVDYDPGENIVIVFENVKSAGGGLDYGDAPASYGSAWHAIADGLSMGVGIDGETAANTSAAADGDDIHQMDDEDGMTLMTPLKWGAPATVCVEIHNKDSNPSDVTVAGWIDFDGNGQWEPIADHIGSRAVHLPPLSIVKECWTFTVPQNAKPGNTLARFRLYRDDPNPLAIPFAVLPFGDGGVGEVEDYQLYILSDAPGPDSERDYGDAPAYPDASHAPGNVWLGQIRPDAEAATQPIPPGLGDDNHGTDDEEGVTFLNDLVPGQPFAMTVKAYVNGVSGLDTYGWIDFNRDGDWDDPGEFLGGAGSTNYSGFLIHTSVEQVPATASPGKTYARFRVYEGPGSGAPFATGGFGGPGEVEDYEVEIKLNGNVLPPGAIFGGVKFHDLNGNGQQDAGEPGLANWVIWIDLNGNGVKDAGEDTLTNPDGSFYFTALAPGAYTVHEELQNGWQQTYPGGAGTHTITAQAGQAVPSIVFGNRHTGMPASDGIVHGYKWNDLNDSGIFDVGEPWLAGWTFWLDQP